MRLSPLNFLLEDDEFGSDFGGGDYGNFNEFDLGIEEEFDWGDDVSFLGSGDDWTTDFNLEQLPDLEPLVMPDLPELEPLQPLQMELPAAVEIPPVAETPAASFLTSSDGSVVTDGSGSPISTGQILQQNQEPVQLVSPELAQANQNFEAAQANAVAAGNNLNAAISQEDANLAKYQQTVTGVALVSPELVAAEQRNENAVVAAQQAETKLQQVASSEGLVVATIQPQAQEPVQLVSSELAQANQDFEAAQANAVAAGNNLNAAISQEDANLAKYQQTVSGVALVSPELVAAEQRNENAVAAAQQAEATLMNVAGSEGLTSAPAAQPVSQPKTAAEINAANGIVVPEADSSPDGALIQRPLAPDVGQTSVVAQNPNTPKPEDVLGSNFTEQKLESGAVIYQGENGNFLQVNPDGSHVQKGADGAFLSIGSDGRTQSIMRQNNDGSYQVQVFNDDRSSTITSTNSKGASITKVVDSDGSVQSISANGKSRADFNAAFAAAKEEGLRDFDYNNQSKAVFTADQVKVAAAKVTGAVDENKAGLSSDRVDSVKADVLRQATNDVYRNFANGDANPIHINQSTVNTANQSIQAAATDQRAEQVAAAEAQRAQQAEAAAEAQRENARFSSQANANKPEESTWDKIKGVASDVVDTSKNVAGFLTDGESWKGMGDNATNLVVNTGRAINIVNPLAQDAGTAADRASVVEGVNKISATVNKVVGDRIEKAGAIVDANEGVGASTDGVGGALRTFAVAAGGVLNDGATAIEKKIERVEEIYRKEGVLGAAYEGVKEGVGIVADLTVKPVFDGASTLVKKDISGAEAFMGTLSVAGGLAAGGQIASAGTKLVQEGVSMTVAATRATVEVAVENAGFSGRPTAMGLDQSGQKLIQNAVDVFDAKTGQHVGTQFVRGGEDLPFVQRVDVPATEVPKLEVSTPRSSGESGLGGKANDIRVEPTFDPNANFDLGSGKPEPTMGGEIKVDPNAHPMGQEPTLGADEFGGSKPRVNEDLSIGLDGDGNLGGSVSTSNPPSNSSDLASLDFTNKSGKVDVNGVRTTANGNRTDFDGRHLAENATPSPTDDAINAGQARELLKDSMTTTADPARAEALAGKLEKIDPDKLAANKAEKMTGITDKAEELGIKVEELPADLVDKGALGRYQDGTRTLGIAPGLSEAKELGTARHEFGHAQTMTIEGEAGNSRAIRLTPTDEGMATIRQMDDGSEKLDYFTKPTGYAIDEIPQHARTVNANLQEALQTASGANVTPEKLAESLKTISDTKKYLEREDKMIGQALESYTQAEKAIAAGQHQFVHQGSSAVNDLYQIKVETPDGIGRYLELQVPKGMAKEDVPDYLNKMISAGRNDVEHIANSSAANAKFASELEAAVKIRQDRLNMDMDFMYLANEPAAGGMSAVKVANDGAFPHIEIPPAGELSGTGKVASNIFNEAPSTGLVYPKLDDFSLGVEGNGPHLKTNEGAIEFTPVEGASEYKIVKGAERAQSSSVATSTAVESGVALDKVAEVGVPSQEMLDKANSIRFSGSTREGLTEMDPVFGQRPVGEQNLKGAGVYATATPDNDVAVLYAGNKGTVYQIDSNVTIQKPFDVDSFYSAKDAQAYLESAGMSPKEASAAIGSGQRVSGETIYKQMTVANGGDKDLVNTILKDQMGHDMILYKIQGEQAGVFLDKVAVEPNFTPVDFRPKVSMGELSLVDEPASVSKVELAIFDTKSAQLPLGEVNPKFAEIRDTFNGLVKQEADLRAAGKEIPAELSQTITDMNTNIKQMVNLGAATSEAPIPGVLMDRMSPLLEKAQQYVAPEVRVVGEAVVAAVDVNPQFAEIRGEFSRLITLENDLKASGQVVPAELSALITNMKVEIQPMVSLGVTSPTKLIPDVLMDRMSPLLEKAQEYGVVKSIAEVKPIENFGLKSVDDPWNNIEEMFSEEPQPKNRRRGA